MNLRIGNVRNYNNKILISSPSFKIGTNAKINLDGEEDKPDVKPKRKPDIKSNNKHKPNIKLKQDVKMIRTEPDMNKITYEEEKVVLILGTTTVFTLLWMFK